MFDRLFRGPSARARQRTGPLADERRGYLAHCAEQQMAPSTLRHVANYTLEIAEVLRLAERPGEHITWAEIEAAANRWANKPAKRRLLTFRFKGQAYRWLTFLGRLQIN